MTSQSLAPSSTVNANHHASQYSEFATMKGSAGPVLRTLCDAGVIPCDMMAATEGFEERMKIHCLVYLARSRFGCPNLEHFDFHVFAGVPYSPILDWSFELEKRSHDYDAIDWPRQAEFAKFARNYASDYEWLSAASLFCIVTDMRNDESLPTGHDDILDDSILDGLHMSGDRAMSIYESLPKALRQKTG